MPALIQRTGFAASCTPCAPRTAANPRNGFVAWRSRWIAAGIGLARRRARLRRAAPRGLRSRGCRAAVTRTLSVRLASAAVTAG